MRRNGMGSRMLRLSHLFTLPSSLTTPHSLLITHHLATMDALPSLAYLHKHILVAKSSLPYLYCHIVTALSSLPYLHCHIFTPISSPAQLHAVALLKDADGGRGERRRHPQLPLPLQESLQHGQGPERAAARLF